jgi:ribosomal protein S18 acetylase RimI-like enzyme
MKNLLSKLLKFLIGEWIIFYIFKKEINPLPPLPINRKIEYTQKRISNEYYKISIYENNTEICSLGVIWGTDYTDNFRNYIPLKQNEAKIIDVVTAKEFRGKGYVGMLLTHTESEMLSKGATTLLARVWHSNKSSKKAFQKNGWAYAGFKLELKLFNLFPISYMSYRSI